MGEQDRRHARSAVGLVVAQPAQLGDREGGDQHAADRVGARLRTAHLGDQVVGRAGGAGVVPEQGVAHRLAVGVEGDHAVLLAGDGDRVGPLEQAVGRVVDGAEPGPGIDLGAGRVRSRAYVDDAPVVGVDEERLGRLGR